MTFGFKILILLGVILAVTAQPSFDRGFGRPGWPGRPGRPGRPGGGVPRWCPPGSPRIFCFANPCDVERCPAYPWARCINDDPCEPACIGNFYFRGRRLSRRQCQRRRPW